MPTAAEDKISATVATAIALARNIRLETERLDALKQELRDYATVVNNHRPDDEKGQVEITSPEGMATVVFVSDGYRVIEGADLGTLKPELPRRVYSLLFQEKVTLAADFGKSLMTVKPALRRRVARLVEGHPNAPRVLLPQ